MIESVYSFLMGKDDLCLHDISKVQLPEKICPFGFKRERDCPFDYDLSKCPHHLDEMGLREIGEYLCKVLYYDEDDKDKNEDFGSQVSPELIAKLKAHWEQTKCQKSTE
jgi:hypothetical protein